AATRPASELCRRRRQQSNGCACALSLHGRPGHALSHPRHEPARMDRTRHFVGLHTVDQRGHHRSLQPREDGRACGGAGTKAGCLTCRICLVAAKPSERGLRPINKRIDRCGRRKKLAELVSIYGIWVVAAFIALESVGIPLPAEAALIAAGFFAARTHGLEIWSLITAGIVAAIFGEIVGFWIGRRFGHQLLVRYGTRLGMTEGRIRIGQWLFVRYGGRFVFIARFLPFLRNIAAVLAGTNAMTQRSFYFASATAAAAWI